MQATVSGTLDAVYRLCIWASGLSIALMSLIVPWGVFAPLWLYRLWYWNLRSRPGAAAA